MVGTIMLTDPGLLLLPFFNVEIYLHHQYEVVVTEELGWLHLAFLSHSIIESGFLALRKSFSVFCELSCPLHTFKVFFGEAASKWSHSIYDVGKERCVCFLNVSSVVKDLTSVVWLCYWIVTSKTGSTDT